MLPVASCDSGALTKAGRCRRWNPAQQNAFGGQQADLGCKKRCWQDPGLSCRQDSLLWLCLSWKMTTALLLRCSACLLCTQTISGASNYSPVLLLHELLCIPADTTQLLALRFQQQVSCQCALLTSPPQLLVCLDPPLHSLLQTGLPAVQSIVRND